MKIVILSTSLLLMISTNADAQSISKKAVSGAIYLNNGEEVVTPFVYHETEQVIIRKDNAGIQVYTIFHVDSFFFYDPELMWQRRFKKMKYRDREYFFETVTPGEVSIVRLKLPHSAPDRVVLHEAERHQLDYRYFIRYQQNLSNLNSYSMKSLKQIHPEYWSQLRKFARMRQLNFHKMGDKIQMVQKLNDLINKKDSFR